MSNVLCQIPTPAAGRPGSEPAVQALPRTGTGLGSGVLWGDCQPLPPNMPTMPSNTANFQPLRYRCYRLRPASRSRCILIAISAPDSGKVTLLNRSIFTAGGFLKLLKEFRTEEVKQFIIQKIELVTDVRFF